MARATIPYDYFNRFLLEKYPQPAFQQRFVVKQYSGRNGMTPVRAYDRTTGNFKAIGWFVEVQYSILTGINQRFLEPEYQVKSELIFIPDEQ